MMVTSRVDTFLTLHLAYISLQLLLWLISQPPIHPLSVPWVDGNRTLILVLLVQSTKQVMAILGPDWVVMLRTQPQSPTSAFIRCTYFELFFVAFLFQRLTFCTSRGLRHVGFKFQDLAGPFPVEIANLQRVASIDLSYNSLTGILPNQFQSPLLSTL